MAGKLTFIVGAGVGYVLGARAGRERYEQISQQARKVWRDPRVQDKAEQAQHLAQEKAGQAGEVLKDKAAQAGDAVRDKVAEVRSDDDASSPRPGGGTLS